MTIAINFDSLKDTKEERVMHLRNNNIKFKPYNEANEAFNELFESLRLRYQLNLETPVRSSDFVFGSVKLLYYKCQKVNFKRGGSNIDSPNWIKNKKVIANQKIEDDKCFQYAETVELNYEEIKQNLKRGSSIKPFINKYNWEEINNASKINDWKRFENSN